MLRKKGFTLIEILFVIIIIGALIGLAIPNYAGAIERSRCAYALSMLKSIRNAATLFYREHGSFVINNAGAPEPMTLADLEQLAGTKFYSDGSNPHWQFAILNPASEDFDLRATRLRGQHSALFIELSAEDKLSGTYPFTNPGQF